MKYGKIVYVLRIKGGLELKKIYVDMENKKMCICHTNNIELINLDKILEYEIIFEKNVFDKDIIDNISMIISFKNGNTSRIILFSKDMQDDVEAFRDELETICSQLKACGIHKREENVIKNVELVMNFIGNDNEKILKNFVLLNKNYLFEIICDENELLSIEEFLYKNIKKEIDFGKLIIFSSLGQIKVNSVIDKKYLGNLKMFANLIKNSFENTNNLKEEIFEIACNISAIHGAMEIKGNEFEQKYNCLIKKVKFINVEQFIKQIMLELLEREIEIDTIKYDLLFYMLNKKFFGEQIQISEVKKEYFKIFDNIKEEIKYDKFKEKLIGNEVIVSNRTINDVDLMNGDEFENFIGELFSKLGYNTNITKHSGDQGIDVIAENNNVRIGIQAKCYSGTVGNSAVQEAVAGKKFYKLDKVIVVTNSFFTSSAIELASANNVILWDRNILKEKLLEV